MDRAGADARPDGPTWSAARSDALWASSRLAGAHAAQSAAEAMDLRCNAAGTTAIYASSCLERCCRDGHVAPQHIAVAPSHSAIVGQSVLGLGRQGRR